jgi:hypothetical protein
MKTSKKDFAIFKEQFQYWIQKMGLLSWEYSYIHSKENTARADVICDHASKMVRVTLHEDWENDELTHRTICMVAFHEAHEVKYSQLSKLMSQFYSEDLTCQMIHELIRLDESYIFEPYYLEKYGE